LQAEERRRRAAKQHKQRDSAMLKRKKKLAYEQTAEFRAKRKQAVLQQAILDKWLRKWLKTLAIGQTASTMMDIIEKSRAEAKADMAARCILRFVKRWRMKKKRSKFHRYQQNINQMLNHRLLRQVVFNENNKRKDAFAVILLFLHDSKVGYRAKYFYACCKRLRMAVVRVQRAYRRYKFAQEWKVHIGCVQLINLMKSKKKREKNTKNSSQSQHSHHKHKSLAKKKLPLKAKKAAAFADLNGLSFHDIDWGKLRVVRPREPRLRMSGAELKAQKVSKTRVKMEYVWNLVVNVVKQVYQDRGRFLYAQQKLWESIYDVHATKTKLSEMHHTHDHKTHVILDHKKESMPLWADVAAGADGRINGVDMSRWLVTRGSEQWLTYPVKRCMLSDKELSIMRDVVDRFTQLKFG